MTTMNISLPDALKAFVDGQVAGGDYGTSSEYVRSLIRRDQAQQQLRSLILEGLASPGAPMEDDYFDKLRAKVRNSAR